MYLFQEKDHYRHGPHLVLGFLRLNSGMFPERFRIVPGPVVSKRICLILTERQEFDSLSEQTPETISFSPFFFLRHLSKKVLVDSKKDCLR